MTTSRIVGLMPQKESFPNTKHFETSPPSDISGRTLDNKAAFIRKRSLFFYSTLDLKEPTLQL